MEIKKRKGNIFALNRQQQLWIGDEVLQTAFFAGQEMMAIADAIPGQYRLEYLFYTVDGYASIDDAKEAAPAFASEVLQNLLGTLRPVVSKYPMLDPVYI